MGFEKGITKDKIKKIVSFLESLKHSKLKDRHIFISKLENREIDYISEICLNLLHLNIKPPHSKISLLNRLKTVIQALISKTKSYKIKKKLLSSIKGLQLLNIILPIALKTLSNYIS